MAALTTQCTQCAAVLRLRDKRLIGRKLRCPRCKARFVAAEHRRQRGPKTNRRTPPTVVSFPTAPEISEIPVIRTERSDGISAVARRRRRSRGPAIPVACLLLAAGGATLLWFANGDPIVDSHTTNASAPDTAPSDNEKGKNDAAGQVKSAAPLSPVSGPPISLECIPVVPQLVLHLRPQEIWSEKTDRREFTATLGDLGIWLREFIQQTTGFAPSEIDELTIAVNFGARASQPDIAAVARLTEPQRASEVFGARPGATRLPELAAAVYESNGLAFMMVDPQTIAVSSLELAEDLVDAVAYAPVPPPEMEVMLQESDRSRHVTLIADLRVLDVHRELLLMSQLHGIAEDALLWFGSDCRMLSWTAHLKPHVHMQTRMAHAAESTARRLHARVQQQLEQLPERLLTAVRTMRPSTVGHRRIIGRFPAMMQAVAVGTQFRQSESGTILTTVLPRKAAANLAAGAILTWNQTVLADSGRSVASMAARPARPKSVAERLQQPVLIDFRREPLQVALEYIGREIQVPVVIDGDALKLGGFTQNMPQTHSLGKIPAIAAIDAILRQYEGKMVIVVIEDQRTLLVTTSDAADAEGLEVFATSADGAAR